MNILLINQCFFPDVVATAQYLTDLALGLKESGHAVTVLTNKRGYDDYQTTYPSYETWKDIRIIRVSNTGFGKRARWRRFLDFSTFCATVTWRLLRMPRFDVVVVLTSPPLVSVLATLFVKLKGGKLVYWVMDLNPDQSLAAGWLRNDSLTAKILEKLSVFSLRHASKVVVLDRFMKNRVLKKGISEKKLNVIPPWSQEQHIAFDPDGRAAFRERYGLTEKFVIMYSGNHSPCHPLDTILHAAYELRQHQNIAFAFVGGGSEFEKVQRFSESRSLRNVVCLPYQPLHDLAASLSAADLHVVVMGDAFPGIVHPCKIYNILLMGVPFLYVGPPESHITDIVRSQALNGRALLASHGDVAQVEQHILKNFQKWDKNSVPGIFRSVNGHSKDHLLRALAETIES